MKMTVARVIGVVIGPRRKKRLRTQLSQMFWDPSSLQIVVVFWEARGGLAAAMSVFPT